MKTKTLKEKRQLISKIIKTFSLLRDDYSFIRYLHILNNYLKGFPLSRIEKNHKLHNCPRKYYLQMFAKGFDIEIDYESDLFEGKIDESRKFSGYISPDSYYKRFFERFSFLELIGRELTHESIRSCLSYSSLLWTKTYFILDENQKMEIQSRINYIGTILYPGIGGIELDQKLAALLGFTAQSMIQLKFVGSFPYLARFNGLFFVLQLLHSIASDGKHLLYFLLNERVIFDTLDTEDGSVSWLNFIITNSREILENPELKKECVDRYTMFVNGVENEK